MPNPETTILNVKGFKAVGIHAGLKKEQKLDMALIVSNANCVSAGVFTQNRLKAAPVTVSEEHLQIAGNRMRAVIVNTTCANAGTGAVGLENARIMARLTAQQLNCEPEQVFVMSTGVIGSHLPMAKIDAGIQELATRSDSDWKAAATAIMTTDTRPKVASVKVFSPHGEYTITGITKGAGMIAPNMATMLGVLVTDAVLTSEQAQQLLSKTATVSYNRIVVDGDTSTNDCVVLLANGSSGVSLRSDGDVLQFQQALNAVAIQLAQAVVRDGEGATKFITIDVRGAKTEADADQIAHTIASSALVKTAFYGNDANWGRIIAAAGRAGVEFDISNTSLAMAVGESLVDGDRGLILFENGTKARYNESDATAIIKQDSVYVTLDLGSGDAQAIVWTCDLSHEYVSVNADYRS